MGPWGRICQYSANWEWPELREGNRGRHQDCGEARLHTEAVTLAGAEWRACCFRASGSRPGGQLGPRSLMQRNRLQPEGVFAGRNHRQLDWASIPPGVHVLRLQPRAEPRVVDLRIVSPETRFQAALNLQMIQLQFDCRNVLGKIAADIRSANMKRSRTTAFGMCFDDHTYLLFNSG